MSVTYTVPREEWFSHSEYQRRLNAVRASLAQRNLSGAILLSPANICFLTGHHSIDSWEFRAAIVTAERDPVLLLYSFERGRFLASSWLNEARYHPAGADHLQTLAELLLEVGLGSGSLGLECGSQFLNRASYHRLGEMLPEVQWTSVDGLVERVRLVKSAEELECIKRAAHFTKIGMAAAEAAIGDGVWDHEIAAAASQAMLQQGSDNFVMMPTVAVGYRSGLSHSEHGHIRARCGDAVFVELSGCWRHYSAPLMFTTTLGEPFREWTELLEASQQAAEIILKTAHPGIPASSVATAALEVIRPLEHRIQFHYNFGYSLGISFPPHWLEDCHFHIKRDNSDVLQPGMVFHAPLTLRVLGKYAAGTSRTFVITEQGTQVLTGSLG